MELVAWTLIVVAFALLGLAGIALVRRPELRHPPPASDPEPVEPDVRS
ncbi:MAG TPA: hypothetical protein VIC58_12280 [Actinomycetota bacterium]|jgi:hypothetical protein